jgi:hypothetical protein
MWREEVMLCAFLTLAIRGGECSASYPYSFISGKMTPTSCWLGGYVSPGMLYDRTQLKWNWALYCI